MHERNAYRTKAAGICIALLLAAAVQTALDTPAIRAWFAAHLSPRALVPTALFLQTGVFAADAVPAQEQPQPQPAKRDVPAAQTAPEPEQTEPEPEQEPAQEQPAPEQPEPETPAGQTTETASTAAPPTFEPAEADAIGIVGQCSYTVDKAALLTQPLQFSLTAGQPAVLIVHTHTTEAYAMDDGEQYEPLSYARSLEQAHNMVRVGQAVAAVLEENGIGVIHDTTVNDYPSYNGAYDRMKEIIEADLAAHPTIRVVLDIHRDAAADADGNPIAQTVTLDGEEYAQLMLVIGTDEGGLEHPNWQQNLSAALKLQALLNRNWAGLCRPVDLRRERFNENQTPGSMLVEFGTDGNTMTQALRSAKVFAEALAQLLLPQIA